MKKTLAFAFAVIVIIACGGASGGSVICGRSGQCGGGQFCDSSLGCVQCRVDSDCPAGAPRCIEGDCHACATNADCGIASPSCWADYQCHPACTPTSCPPDLPICDSASTACIGCSSNQDCAQSPGKLCDTTLARCVACESNGDCPIAAPKCFLGDHTCFSDGDCSGSTPICDPDFHCHPGCNSNSDCANNEANKICNTADKTCVQCLLKSDCPQTAPLCDTQRGICAICLVDADCAATPQTPHCNRKGNVYSCVP